MKLAELVSVDEGQGADLLHAFDAGDASDGEVEGHVAAVLLLGQDLGDLLLAAEGDVDQELLRVEAAGEVDQVGGDEDAAAAGCGLDQVDLAAFHDVFAVGDALPEAEAADDLLIEGEDLAAQGLVRRGREDPALGGEGIGDVEIEGVADAEVVVVIIQDEGFDDELPPGGELLDDDVAVAGPAGGLGVFVPQLLLAGTDLDAAAALGVQGLDDDAAAVVSEKFNRLLDRGDGAVFELMDAELRHAGAHAALVGKEKACLASDAGEAHVLRDIGDAADGDVGLVCDDAVDLMFFCKGEDGLLVADVTDQAVGNIGFKSFGDDGGGQEDLAGLCRLLDQGELEVARPDDEELWRIGRRHFVPP